MLLSLVILVSSAAVSYAGLLGAGTGHGSCAAFPFRTDDLDHVAGCPRYAECCTEFGYCHPRESWEAGYFRDCNGESNGQPLPGTVIRLEAAEAAKGDDRVSAQVLGISQEIWQSQVQKAVAFLSSSSSSSSSSSEQSSFTGSSVSSSTGTFSSADLIQQILLAIQPQVVQAVQSVVSSQSTSNSGFVSNDITSVNKQENFQSFIGSNQIGSSQFGSSGSSQFGSSGSSQFGSTGSTFSTVGSQSSTGSVDVSELVALVVAQLTPSIQAAVQSAASA